MRLGCAPHGSLKDLQKYQKYYRVLPVYNKVVPHSTLILYDFVLPVEHVWILLESTWLLSFLSFLLSLGFAYAKRLEGCLWRCCRWTHLQAGATKALVILLARFASLVSIGHWSEQVDYQRLVIPWAMDIWRLYSSTAKTEYIRILEMCDSAISNHLKSDLVVWVKAFWHKWPSRCSNSSPRTKRGTWDGLLKPRTNNGCTFAFVALAFFVPVAYDTVLWHVVTISRSWKGSFLITDSFWNKSSFHRSET